MCTFSVVDSDPVEFEIFSRIRIRIRSLLLNVDHAGIEQIRHKLFRTKEAVAADDPDKSDFRF
jgi:hypothetical protein